MSMLVMLGESLMRRENEIVASPPQISILTLTTSVEHLIQPKAWHHVEGHPNMRESVAFDNSLSFSTIIIPDHQEYEL